MRQQRQQWARKPASAAETRIWKLKEQIRQLENLVLPLDDTQKDANVHAHCHEVVRCDKRFGRFR
jgi:hypothetical protein